jgi:hypothetical protein
MAMQPATDRSLSSTAAEISVRWPDGGVGRSIVLTAGRAPLRQVSATPARKALWRSGIRARSVLRVRLVCYSLKQFKFRTIEY